jgi:hypothetical protein
MIGLTKKILGTYKGSCCTLLFSRHMVQRAVCVQICRTRMIAAAFAQRLETSALMWESDSSSQAVVKELLELYMEETIRQQLWQGTALVKLPFRLKAAFHKVLKDLSSDMRQVEEDFRKHMEEAFNVALLLFMVDYPSWRTLVKGQSFSFL